MKKNTFMPISKTMLLLLISFLNSIGSYSQNINFKHLNVKDGLSQMSVMSILSDELGQMWFATRQGLNYYNGQQIRPLTMRTGGEECGFERARNLFADNKGNIYFLSDEELVVYNKQFNTFCSLGKDIMATCYHMDNLWAARGHEILKYNKEKQRLDTYQSLDNLSKEAIIYSLFQDSKNELYFGTEKGLYKLDKNKKEHLIISNINAKNIYEDRHKQLWISSTSGLYKLDNDQIIEHFKADQANPNSLLSNNVRCVVQDLVGNLWIGTSLGLNKLDSSQHYITSYIPQKENIMSLSHQSICSIYCDRQGTIWIGSFLGGVDYFNPIDQIYSYPTADSSAKRHFTIGKRCRIDNKNIIISSFNELYDYNTCLKSFSKVDIPSHVSFTSFALDSISKKIYCGTSDKGIYAYDIIKKRFLTESITKKNSILASNNITGLAIHQDKLYIATNKGFSVYHTTKQTCEPFLSNVIITLSTPSIMVIDSKKRLWIGFLSSKVIEYDIETEKTVLHNELLPKNHLEQRIRVHNIFEDSKQRLWVATSSKGLYRLNEQNKTFELFADQSNGLTRNHCFDIQEGPNGYLVVFESNGISFLDVENKTSSHLHGERFLGGRIMNEGCGCYVDEKFNIIVGTTDGIVAFNYYDIAKDNLTNQLFFSKLFINSEEVSPNDKSGILSQSLPYLSELNLGSQYRSFDIEVSNINYLKLGNDNIEYQLEGFDKDWIKTNQNRIHYTNIKPGKYTLKVRALQSDKKSYAKISLPINIYPPFYASIWALMCYLCIFILTLYFIIRFRESKRRLKLELSYEQREKLRIENMNKERIKFYINLSHELLTPVSLIMAQIETLVIDCKDLNSQMKSRVNRIYRNADMLHLLIKEILDFRKTEHERVNLKISQYNIIPILEEVIDSFKEKARIQNLKISFLPEDTDIVLFVDKKEFQKIISNLLSNAFKFTPADGEISVHCKRNSKKVTIDISDTGVGIPVDSIDKIFDRFYQASNATPSKGTGIGLSYVKEIMEQHEGKISVKNNVLQGCTFTLEFKEGYGHIHLLEQENRGDEVQPDLTMEIQTEELITKIDDEERNQILIVEDNEEMLNLLVSIFQPIYEVQKAHSGEEALEKLSTFMPDIIISDVMMGDFSGIKLCSMIKNNYEICHIPVILLTAQNLEENNIDGLQNGADDYITKPFKVQLLIMRCNNIINNRRMLQNKFANQINFEPQIFATNELDMQFINKAQEVVELNFENTNFGVDLFSKEMAMSRAKLYSKIKGVTGMTPKDFILNIKMKKSAEYLTNRKDLLIADIAYKFGFGSARQFSKSFKELFGESPAKYKKNKESEM